MIRILYINFIIQILMISLPTWTSDFILEQIVAKIQYENPNNFKLQDYLKCVN